MKTSSEGPSRRRGTRGLLLGFAALACMAAPSSAGAAVIVGADNLAQNPGAGASTCGSAAGQGCSVYTITQHDGVAESGSPITGVVVSARVQTTGAAATIGVRVLRPNPMVPLTFLNVAPEIPIPVTADTMMAGHMTEATNLHRPINAGERLGVGWTQPAAQVFIGGNAAPSMAACAFRQGATGDHPVGTEQTYSNLGCAFEILVQGTVEPDADRDNFGDETQDLCPTNAATQGVCPVTAPTQATPKRKRKCKKKRKGAAAAKKKKCRKKRR